MRRALFCFITAFCLTAACGASPLAAADATQPGTGKMRIVYGFDREFPPFSFEDPGGKAVGFEVELLQAIFKDHDLVPRALQWDTLQLELSSGTIHITSGMVRTEQRAKLYSFADKPNFSLQLRMFTKVYNRFPNVTFLRGQTVAVEQGSYQHRLLENFGGINVKPFKDKVSPIKALFNDEVAGYCGPMQNAYYYMKKLNYTGITTLGTPLGITELRYALNRSRGDILKLLNANFARVVTSGEYDRIYRKWFVTELTADETKNMTAAAKNAVLTSYAPYGKRTYGAAVLTATGKIYPGSLVENADQRLSVSALIAAVSSAVGAGDVEIRAALCLDQNGKIVPLGAEECQFLYEFGRGILALSAGDSGAVESRMVGELLPNPVIGQTQTLNIE